MREGVALFSQTHSSSPYNKQFQCHFLPNQWRSCGATNQQSQFVVPPSQSIPVFFGSSRVSRPQLPQASAAMPSITVQASTHLSVLSDFKPAVCIVARNCCQQVSHVCVRKCSRPVTHVLVRRLSKAHSGFCLLS